MKSIKDIDYSGQVLEGVDFSGCTLVNVNFKNATLRHCSFDEATLDGCDFDHSGKAGEPTLGILLTGIFGFILGNKIRNQ